MPYENISVLLKNNVTLQGFNIFYFFSLFRHFAISPF